MPIILLVKYLGFDKTLNFRIKICSYNLYHYNNDINNLNTKDKYNFFCTIYILVNVDDQWS